MSSVDVEIIIQPKGRGKLRREARTAPAAAAHRIPRIARLMALAIRFQEMVDRGEVRDYADLARLGYVSRARLTQIMNLLHLAPAIQESLLYADCVHGLPRLTETLLRPIASLVLWADQLEAFKGPRAGRV
jgi:hypothetical protein